ncbi:unnamed protein product [Ilex paraguariensis]|uniref:DUF7890 domain-containing protein n=1 Tax=Ilex paraguariensis TaxID=185542 RepID=A0ABC8U532_9AQUA
MLGSLESCIYENFMDGRLKARKPKAPGYVYRDELDRKASPSKLKRSDDVDPQPLLQKEVEKHSERKSSSSGCVEGKGGLRVKIVMTKAGAARLLAKSKDGGFLEFKDVVQELVEIPMNRVSVIVPKTNSDRVLESIPEEL